MWSSVPVCVVGVVLPYKCGTLYKSMVGAMCFRAWEVDGAHIQMWYGRGSITMVPYMYKPNIGAVCFRTWEVDESIIAYVSVFVHVVRFEE